MSPQNCRVGHPLMSRVVVVVLPGPVVVVVTPWLVEVVTGLAGGTILPDGRLSTNAMMMTSSAAATRINPARRIMLRRCT